MNAPLQQQNVVAPRRFDSRLELRRAIVEFLERSSIYIAHTLDDADLGDDHALIEDFGRALACFRAAAETVRDLRAENKKQETGEAE